MSLEVDMQTVTDKGNSLLAFNPSYEYFLSIYPKTTLDLEKDCIRISLIIGVGHYGIVYFCLGKSPFSIRSLFVLCDGSLLMLNAVLYWDQLAQDSVHH